MSFLWICFEKLVTNSPPSNPQEMAVRETKREVTFESSSRLPEPKVCVQHGFFAWCILLVHMTLKVLFSLIVIGIVTLFIIIFFFISYWFMLITSYFLFCTFCLLVYFLCLHRTSNQQNCNCMLISDLITAFPLFLLTMPSFKMAVRCWNWDKGGIIHLLVFVLFLVMILFISLL